MTPAPDGLATVGRAARHLGVRAPRDVNGLHIGGNAFRGNEIRNAATAINLG